MSSAPLAPCLKKIGPLLLALGIALSGCATAPAVDILAAAPGAAAKEIQQVLAPTGRLRVAVYPGSPTSLLRTAPGQDERGLSVEIGRELARQLGVPTELLVLERAALMVDALQAGRADMTITNATPARAVLVDFTAPLVGLELGYLTLPGSPVTSLEQVDKPGVRIGVSAGSSSQAALGKAFKNASVVPAPSLKAAGEMLKAAQIDAFATNKAILFELADGLPGARVLDGRWGLESLAIAVPKGRPQAAEFLRRFVEDVRARGLVRQAAERAGLRGLADTSGR